MGTGEIGGLLAAVCWAAASLLYGKTQLTAFGMNYGKNVIAAFVFLLHLCIASALTGRPAFEADAAAWGWLSLSAICGIVAGDTLYFRSLQILGARRCLVVSTTAPLFAAVLGWLFLHESISWICTAGIFLTLAGVCVVAMDRKSSHESPGLFPGRLRHGVALGVAGAVCNALGAVANRHAMKDVDPLEGAFIRILISALASFVFVVAVGRFKAATRNVLKTDVLRWFLPAVLCGTWLGIWLSQIAYKFSPVAIATTLTSTAPIFAIPLVYFFLGHRPTAFGILGTFVAVAGVWLTAL